jgi:predicted AlkP superfamily pyrophosphatase or phosphodiesterase
MRRYVIAALAALSSVAGAQGSAGSGGTNTPAQQRKPYVVLISFDGMKPEYLQRIDLPNFERVMQRGVRSVGMIPTFPSKTFPNHYTIVTGMYAETHGLVGNRFWDPARNEAYSMGDTLDVWDGSWYRGEPIWVAAEKQGMVTASFFWVATEATIGAARPTFWKKYDGRVPNFTRVDTVLTWLALPPQNRPHIITLYFSETDGAAHAHGPLSAQLDTAAKNVDAALGRLLDGIERMPLKDSLYLVLVSDHGMSETSPRWFAGLDTLIDTTGVRNANGTGPLANLYVQGGRARAIVLRDSINRRMRHGRAYVRGELPAHLHYNKDPRIGDLVVVMDDHFQIGQSNRPAREGGNHGWDPTLPNMHAIFVASGPRIPRGKVIPSFENIHVYPWLTEILGLRPAAAIDGARGRLAEMIRTSR